MKKLNAFLHVTAAGVIASPLIAISCTQSNDQSHNNDNQALTDLNNKINALNNQLTQKDKEIEKLNKKILELQNNTSNIENEQIKELKTKVSNLIALNEQLSQTLNDNKNLIANLENQVLTKGQNIDQLKVELANKSNEMLALSSQISSLQVKIGSMEGQIDALTNSKNTLTMQLSQVNKQLASLQESLALKQSLLEAAQEKIAKLTEEINELKKNNSSTSSDSSTKPNHDSTSTQPTSPNQGSGNQSTTPEEQTNNHNSNPSSNTSGEETNHTSPEDSHNADASVNTTSMFELKKNIQVTRGSHFDLNSLVTINNNYVAKKEVRRIDQNGMLTTKGVYIPPVPKDNEIPTVKDGNLLTNPPIGKWFKTTPKFDPDDRRYFYMWSEEDNWFDSNKWFRHTNGISPSDEDNYYPYRTYGNGGTDDWSCWAAASSNVMMWWIQQNYKYIEAYYKMYPQDRVILLNGKDILQSYKEKDYAFLLNYFCEYFTDKAGFTLFGNQWLLSGVKNNNFNAAIEQDKLAEAQNFRGLFPHLFNWDNIQSLGDYKKFAGGLSNADRTFSDYVKYALENDYAVSFTITYASTNYNHAVTMWGAHFNDQGIVDEVYYVNSDEDNKELRTRSRLVRAKVFYEDNNRQVILWSFPEQTDISKQSRSWTPITSVEKFSNAHDMWEKWYKDNVDPIDDKVIVNIINGDQFDINTAGTYKIKYQATDKFGNTQTQVSTITVK
ncbi:IdeS/Mac family cysteine endopeptidase [Mycoplasma sp. 005V]|uniref:IdeS/Mac family cysteine endopeptidase n=1 Tax=unclassified Mycoplasma TaxID=2683645 RepID=UPI003A89137E